MEDIQQLKTELGKTWDEFKGYVDREFSEVKKNGVASPETKEALAKMNDTMSALTSRIDQFEAKAARPNPEDEQKRANTEQNAAFSKWMRKGDQALSEVEHKAMTVQSDPDGGYRVTPDVGGRIVTKLFDTTPMRQIADVVTISTDAIEGMVDRDEATVGWVAETASRTSTATPTIAKWRLETFEIYANPPISQKLLDDADFNVENWLAGKVSDKFARTQNDAFINGNGTTKPKGFTTYTTAATADATRTWGQLEHVKTGANGDFGASNPADQLFDLVYAMKAGYRAGSKFIMPKAALAKIRKFKEATTNAYIWQPGLQKGEPSALLGYPIVESEDMPALATNSLSLAFGNFTMGYQIVDRVGIRVLRDPYTNKPYVNFYTTARVGGGVINFDAIKFLKFAA